MIDAAWRRAVDRYWADALGCELSLLDEPGAHLVSGGAELVDYQGLYLLRLDTSLLVYAPPARRAEVEARMAGARVDVMFSRVGAARLADGSGLVLGPSRHHYADQASAVSPLDDVRELAEQDEGLLDGLHHACGDADWHEGGFGERPARNFGIVENSTLVAAGNLTEWLGTFSDVGLVTHPGYRRRGHARALTRAMTRAALDGAGVVRYRALTTNAASLAVARREGFLPYGENIAVRLAS